MVTRTGQNRPRKARPVLSAVDKSGPQRGARVDPAMRQAIELHWSAGGARPPSAAAIRRRLDADPPNGLTRDDVPSERTIRAIIHELRHPEPGAPWSLLSPGSADPAIVLDALRDLADRAHLRGARFAGFTLAEAEVVTRIQRARPTSAPLALTYARLYLQRQAAGQPVLDLDLQVARGTLGINPESLQVGAAAGLFRQLKTEDDDA